MNDQNKHEAPKMIEMPEHLRITSEATSRELGDSAVRAGGMFGNGVIPVDRGPGIPVEHPSAATVQKIGVKTMIDGQIGYVLPGQTVEPREEK